MSNHKQKAYGKYAWPLFSAVSSTFHTSTQTHILHMDPGWVAIAKAGNHFKALTEHLCYYFILAGNEWAQHCRDHPYISTVFSPKFGNSGNLMPIAGHIFHLHLLFFFPGSYLYILLPLKLVYFYHFSNFHTVFWTKLGKSEPEWFRFLPREGIW